MEIIISISIDSNTSELRKIELSDEQVLAIGNKYFELYERRGDNLDKHRDNKDFKCKDCKSLKRVVVNDSVRYICTSETRTRNYHNKHNKYDFKYESQPACKSGFELGDNSDNR